MAIYYVGTPPEQASLFPKFCQTTFSSFLFWLHNHGSTQVELDIETTVDEQWCKKKLICLQFGELYGKDQWVLQWSALDDKEKDIIRRILEHDKFTWYIHNALFECVVMRFHGARIHKVYDTMLMELVLNTGTEFGSEEIEDNEDPQVAGFFSLAATIYRYIGKTISKDQQMLFGDDLMTEDKIVYGATDVRYLGAIARLQKVRLAGEDLEFVAGLENEVLPAFAEMTFYGMKLDREKWTANEDLAIKVIASTKAKVDSFVTGELFWRKAVDMGFYDPLDRTSINWNSAAQKKQIVEHFFPFLQDKVSKAVLTRLAKHPELFSDPRGVEIVNLFLGEEWNQLETIIIEADRAWLIDKEFLTPGGAVTINWNSPPQALAMVQCVKKVKSTNEQTMQNLGHPIGQALLDYRSALKLLTQYGEAFFKYIEADGYVRTSWNQIVSTGRGSSRKPNMQNIPVYEEVGTRYRNAFVCEEDEEFVSSDFSQQELVTMAYISQEPAWMDALRLGQDLHSVCAEMVYKQRWKDAAEPDCAYYHKGKVKCSCKRHKVMRTEVKTINFGIPYGMQAKKLSAGLNISASAAGALLKEYFTTFPKLKRLLDYLQQFGLRNGYIMTLAPFFRKRWFPYWHLAKHRLSQHNQGQYDATLGEIEREAGNMPIQGSGADMMKTAAILIYQKIHENGWGDRVRMVMQVHDQIDCVTKKWFTATWKPVMHQCMLDAAMLVVPNGLLGADTTISPYWTK